MTNATAPLVLAEAPIQGGKAQFIALDHETLLIATDAVANARPLYDPELRGLDAAQMYEHWTGETAPPALVEMVEKVARSGAATAEDSERVTSTKAALTAAQFQDMHCSGEEYCWTNKTGTWENDERARYWEGWVDAKKGNISVQMRRDEVIGGWTPVWSADVLEGHTQQFSATSEVLNKRHLKFKIFNADGDTWHFAGTWD